MEMPDWVALTRPPAGTPVGALVLFHGRGADERDLEPLAQALDPAHRWLWALPRGPLTAGFGFAWYELHAIGAPEPTSFERSRRLAASWLRGLADQVGGRVALVGFSQGTVMAYALALDPAVPRPLAVVGLSGYLAEPPDADWSRARGLPVWVEHGRHDPVVPVRLARDAAERWRAAGALVELREFEGGHWVDVDHLPRLAEWLRQAAGGDATGA